MPKNQMFMTGIRHRAIFDNCCWLYLLCSVRVADSYGRPLTSELKDVEKTLHPYSFWTCKYFMTTNISGVEVGTRVSLGTNAAPWRVALSCGAATKPKTTGACSIIQVGWRHLKRPDKCGNQSMSTHSQTVADGVRVRWNQWPVVEGMESGFP